MNRKSMEQLKLDIRLAGRRGWIAPSDLQAALEALPDVSNKIAPSEADEAAGGEPAEPAALPANS